MTKEKGSAFPLKAEPFCLIETGALIHHVLELAVVQVGIEAACLHELVVGALLHDVAVPHDKDQVGVLDGGQAVCDDKAGAALHQTVHGGLDALLGAGIHTAGSFIQNQDAVVGQDGAGDGQQLLLALADVGSVLVQLHLVAAGQGADEVVGVGGLGGSDDFLVSGVQTAVADVLHDGALEQPGVLQHHAEAFPQGAAVKVPQVVAVQGDGTGVYIVEPHQQLDHGGLAGTGGADDGHLLAGFHVAAEVVDDGLFGHIAEFDMIEGDLTVDAGRVCPAGRIGLLVLFGLVQELKDALGSGGHALQHVGHLRQLLDGLGEVLDVLDEGLDIADGDGAVGGKDTADDGHGHIAQIAHKVHDGLHQAGEELALPGGFKQLVVGGAEILQHGGLPVEGLDDVVAGVDFLHLAVDDAQGGLLGLEVLLAEPDHQQHQCQRHRQDQDGDQGHLGADGQHHDQHTDHGGDAGDELGDALVQALAQGVHIIGDAGEYLTHGPLLKVGQGQAVDFLADLAAEVVADLLGQAGHQPALDEAEGCRAQVHGQQDQQDLADIAEVDAADAPQLLDPAGGKGCGGLCKDLGACNVEDGREDGKNDHDDEGEPVAAHGTDQLPQSPFEILGALGGLTSGSWHITPPPFRYAVPRDSVLSGSAGSGRSPDTRGRRPSAGHGCRSPPDGPRPGRGSGWRGVQWRCAAPR